MRGRRGGGRLCLVEAATAVGRLTLRSTLPGGGLELVSINLDASFCSKDVRLVEYMHSIEVERC